jgi:hypothetical protein
MATFLKQMISWNAEHSAGTKYFLLISCNSTAALSFSGTVPFPILLVDLLTQHKK